MFSYFGNLSVRPNVLEDARNKKPADMVCGLLLTLWRVVERHPPKRISGFVQVDRKKASEHYRFFATQEVDVCNRENPASGTTDGFWPAQRRSPGVPAVDTEWLFSVPP